MTESWGSKEYHKGKDNPMWRGGKRKRNGYIQIWSPNHPYSDKKRYVMEHRLVMESHLGRFLLPLEVVHHINGIITDNRIENLALFSRSGEHNRNHVKLRRRDNAGKFIKK